MQSLIANILGAKVSPTDEEKLKWDSEEQIAWASLISSERYGKHCGVNIGRQCKQ